MKIEVISLNENLEGMKLEVGGVVTVMLSPSRLFIVPVIGEYCKRFPISLQMLFLFLLVFKNTNKYINK